MVQHMLYHIVTILILEKCYHSHNKYKYLDECLRVVVHLLQHQVLLLLVAVLQNPLDYAASIGVGGQPKYLQIN